MLLTIVFAACSLIEVFQSARPSLEETRHDTSSENKEVRSRRFSLHGFGEFHQIDRVINGALNNSHPHIANDVPSRHNDAAFLQLMETSPDMFDMEDDFGHGQNRGSRQMHPGQMYGRNPGRQLSPIKDYEQNSGIPLDCQNLKNSRGILQQGLRTLCIELATEQTSAHNLNEKMADKTNEKIDNWIKAGQSLHGAEADFQRIAQGYKRGMLNNIQLATQVLQAHPTWGAGEAEGPKPLVGMGRPNMPEQHMSQPGSGLLSHSHHSQSHSQSLSHKPNLFESDQGSHLGSGEINQHHDFGHTISDELRDLSSHPQKVEDNGDVDEFGSGFYTAGSSFDLDNTPKVEDSSGLNLNYTTEDLSLD